MSAMTKSSVSLVIKREWWVVVAVVVVALAVVLSVSSGKSTTFVGESSVKLDATTLSKYPALMVGDRTAEMLQQSPFYVFAGAQTGMAPAAVKSSLQTSANGKYLDTVLVRFTADSSAAAKAGAQAMADAIAAYAYSVAAPEIDRQKQITKLNEDSITRIKELSARFSNNAYQLADVEARLTPLEQTQVNLSANLKALEAAYVPATSATVAPAVGSNRSDLVGAALLAGLVAGLGLALLRERLLRRSAA